jgi:23S rRNA (uracil1939-C5)-methyltransferase
MARAALRFSAALTLCPEPVEVALQRLVAAGAQFPTVVLDPPRAGAREAMGWLPRLGAERVIYVSCDAMTLARDLTTLTGLGYRPRYVQPLDLMPHTAEIECVAVCDREPVA